MSETTRPAVRWAIAIMAAIIVAIMIGIYLDCRISGRQIEDCVKAFGPLRDALGMWWKK